MGAQVLRVGWYRLRATFGRRWGGYLGLVLVIGLAGGVALGSAAAARRTESSFPDFLASTNPSDLSVEYGTASYAGLPTFARTVAHLPHVRRAASALWPIGALGRNGVPATGGRAAARQLQIVGSVNGLFFTQDRVSVIAGRMADPRRPGQVMMDAQAARLLGLRVGALIPMGFYTDAQALSPQFGTRRVRPVVRIQARLVGLVVFNNAVVQDDIDRPQAYLLLTPALTRVLLAAGTSSGLTWYGLQLAHGARDVAAVEREINRHLGSTGDAEFHVASVNQSQAQSAIEPDWIALAAFAVIAGLATLIIAAQAIARQVRADGDDLRVLRALGAGPAMAAADCLLGIVGAVVAGSLLAAAVAVALSPLAPVGPVRPVYPSPGIAVDWAVLGLGFVALAGGLSAVAVVVAFRGAQHSAAPVALAAARGAGAARLAAEAGLPTSAVAGVHFAFDPGKGRSTVPARSAILGTVLAVVMVVATLTFGSSLATLVSHPPLYGWNWSYALAGGGALETNAIPPQLGSRLRADPAVAAWTTVTFLTGQLDGQTVPMLFASSHAPVTPPILSGHPVDGRNQIVLGPATLAQLHQHVGGTVTMSVLSPPPVTIHARLTIVGTATMPTLGLARVLHTSMGTGALASTQLIGVQWGGGGCAGPPGIAFVRLRSGVSPAAAHASIRRAVAGTNHVLAPAGNPCHSNTVTVLPLQHPAEIANYRTMATTPALLAFALAAAAAAGLGLALFASVHRRRRDLAVLKTIGFTHRQLAATVACQATVAAVIGIAAGVPLGIIAGRWLWILFARQIYAVPQPTVPAGPVLLVALVTVILVNLVAALPGRAAARTPAARALRAE